MEKSQKEKAKTQSRINPLVEYFETKSFDKHDYSRELLKIGNYQIPGTTIAIDVIIGNQIIRNNISYFNFYAAANEKRLGLFEFKTDELAAHLDIDGDLDIFSATPILFSFVNHEFLESILKIQNQQKNEQEIKQMIHTAKTQPLIQVKIDPEPDDIIEENTEEDPEEEELIASASTPITEKIPTPSSTQNTLYDYSTKPAEKRQLPAETEKEARAKIQEYRDFKKTKHSAHWVNERMKNLQYETKPTDDFLHILEQTVAQIGKITTPKRCKTFLANHPSLQAIFREDQRIFSELETLKHEQENRVFLIVARLDDIAKLLAKSSKTKVSSEDTVRLKEEQARLQIDKKNTEADIEELNHDIQSTVEHMKNITTLEHYKNYIQSTRFQMNQWAVQTLEHEFNIKFLLFRKNLSPLTPDKIFTASIDKIMRPDYYVLLASESDEPGNDFGTVALVLYKNHCIFQFDELPHSVKCLATHKITSTPFRFLPDFTTFKGCAPAQTTLTAQTDPTQTILKIDSPIIPKNKWVYFRKLRQIKDWHLILDDDFLFEGLRIDNHEWPSVTHYVVAGHFPESSVYYLEFVKDPLATETNNVITKSAEIAKEAAQNAGVYRLKNPKKTSLALNNIEYIPNYKIVKNPNPKLNERRATALKHKFESNPIFKNILLWTLDATLQNNSGQEDTLLMQLRNELRGTEYETYNKTTEPVAIPQPPPKLKTPKNAKTPNQTKPPKNAKPTNQTKPPNTKTTK